MTCKECAYLGVDTSICLKCSQSYENKFKPLNVCANCKHLEYIEKSFKRCVELDINIGHLTWDEFYCAYWEAKNENE